MHQLHTLNTSTDSACTELGVIFTLTLGRSAAAHLLCHTQYKLLFRAIQQRKEGKKKKTPEKARLGSSTAARGFI